MEKSSCEMGGVQVIGNQIFIGSGVSFDTVYPEKIYIHNHVHITTGVIILTHYLDTLRTGVKWLSDGETHIMDGVFIGANSIITKPLTIGENSIIAAGSVVTKNIPPNEIWGGNPAKFIKKRI